MREAMGQLRGYESNPFLPPAALWVRPQGFPGP